MVVSGNMADNVAGILNIDARATIRRSTFSGNTAAGAAGAIGNDPTSVLMLEDSTVSGNSAAGAAASPA